MVLPMSVYCLVLLFEGIGNDEGGIKTGVGWVGGGIGSQQRMGIPNDGGRRGLVLVLEIHSAQIKNMKNILWQKFALTFLTTTRKTKWKPGMWKYVMRWYGMDVEALIEWQFRAASKPSAMVWLEEQLCKHWVRWETRLLVTHCESGFLYRIGYHFELLALHRKLLWCWVAAIIRLQHISALLDGVVGITNGKWRMKNVGCF